jgi:hypothetical protein
MIFGRLTADTGKHQVRYRAREYQNSFAIHTDDPAVFECVSESDANRTINAALDIFDEEGVLFNLAEGLCALPAYFDFKITLVREVNKEVLPPSTKPTKGTRRHAKPQGKRFCKVAALEILNPARRPSFAVTNHRSIGLRLRAFGDDCRTGPPAKTSKTNRCKVARGSRPTFGGEIGPRASRPST